MRLKGKCPKLSYHTSNQGSGTCWVPSTRTSSSSTSELRTLHTLVDWSSPSEVVTSASWGGLHSSSLRASWSAEVRAMTIFPWLLQSSHWPGLARKTVLNFGTTFHRGLQLAIVALNARPWFKFDDRFVANSPAHATARISASLARAASPPILDGGEGEPSRVSSWLKGLLWYFLCSFFFYTLQRSQDDWIANAVVALVLARRSHSHKYTILLLWAYMGGPKCILMTTPDTTTKSHPPLTSNS